MQTDGIVPAGAKSQIQATVQIPLEIEISVIAWYGGKEKFHTAVLAHLSQRRMMHCPDVRVYSVLVDVDCRIIIVHLLCHADVCIRQPQDIVDRQRRYNIPLGFGIGPLNIIGFHDILQRITRR